MKKQLTYNDSIDLIEKITIKNRKIQKLFLSQSFGFVLATDIKASQNSPKYPTSGMDGYAIKFEDQDKEELVITDFNPAGSVVKNCVKSSTCIKTFTGSLMPHGSDTLIPIENVEVLGNKIKINQKVPFGFAVRSVGENYKENEILIKKGTVIGFAEIGVMASLNIVFVEIYAKPKVAICSTGSEILDLGEEMQNEAQIRSSNHLTIEALCNKFGAEPIMLGVVKDDKQTITQTLQNALVQSDILITTGGVSVGDYDFVKDIVKDSLGADVILQGVNIKPGQHILIAQKDEKFIVSLPGFAYSSTITFLIYALNLIFKFRGACEKLQVVDAILEHDLPKKANKAIFTACNIRYENEKFFVNTVGKKEGSSGILTNMLGNCAIIFQGDDNIGNKKNDIVQVILI